MTETNSSAPSATFVLVPGFWLGAWAWDEVAGPLRAAGHRVEAMTLPGLEGRDTPRAGVTLADHVNAVTEHVAALDPGVILAGHSGAGRIVSAVTDLIPDRIRRVVYVDSGPQPDGATHQPTPGPDVTEIPLPSWAEFEADGVSLAGLDEATLARWADRALPQPAGPAREPIRLVNPAREQVPVTMITSSFPSSEIMRLAAEGHRWFAELPRLKVSYIDLPTGHWPMWSRPGDLAAALADTAAA
ncbi:MAG TPA: alpha/beta hydrolase [Streptosporangiaceae bacterium]|jgi:pimeloyl-ACP methyl ester carboxylesterase|nr:alpha/beta hydrolase [Streptosporangiaceae bacterium]